MGLFDDILKKPVNSPSSASQMNNINAIGSQSGSMQTSVSTGTTPIVIEKSSEQVVFGEEAAALEIARQNAPMAIPTSHAEEDTSSILVELTPLETATPSLMPNIEIHSEELSPITSPMTTPTLVTETPQVMPNIAATPMINMAANQSPLTSAQIMMAQSAPSSNIFDSIMSQAPAVAEVAPVMPESIGQETLTPIAGSPTEDLLSPKQAPTDQTASVYTASFATPRAFIEQSIANIDVMLGNIDRRHDAKAAEEESYKIEKLRYTELEHTAHNEKIIMDKERDHALHMKQILESERQRDENNRALKDTPNASVTSTLAGIGEEHAFSHKHSHKKSEARQNEEELLVAS